MRKTILITGAGSGIGKDTAVTLSKRGHRIIATTETEEQSVQLKEDPEFVGIEVFKLDIADRDDRSKITEYNLDVLINNAGIGESGSLADIDMNKVRHNFEVNVFSSFELSQLVLKKMLEKDSGTILFISSLAGRISFPFLGSYSMTKHALSSGAEALRSEIGRISKNVHVSIIEPGGFHTGFNQKMLAKKYRWITEESPFYRISDQLKIEEQRQFRLTEAKTTKGIVRKIAKASEARKPALRYSSPWWQAFGVRMMRVFGR